jgi:uncharacterized membrane protein YhaH (DUF805 family)
MNNPYTAPDAALTEVDDNETYDPEVFAVNGRIGRLRYLAFSSAVSLVFMLLIGGVSAIFIPMMMGGNSQPVIMLLLMGILYIAMIAVSFIMAKRRFNDLNKSGWLSLLFFVPLANLFVALYLIFGSGTKGSNEYGPQPSKNPTWVVVVSFILPLVFVIGILAAIAIPQYQNYVMRAKAAQMNQNR